MNAQPVPNDMVDTDRRQAPQRGEDRYFIHGERARAHWAGEDRDAAIVNMSPSGIMIAGPFKPEEGDRIELTFASGDTVSCTVRWVMVGRIGLEYAVDSAPAYVRGSIAATRAAPHAISGRRSSGRP